MRAAAGCIGQWSARLLGRGARSPEQQDIVVDPHAAEVVQDEQASQVSDGPDGVEQGSQLVEVAEERVVLEGRAHDLLRVVEHSHQDLRLELLEEHRGVGVHQHIDAWNPDDEVRREQVLRHQVSLYAEEVFLPELRMEAVYECMVQNAWRLGAGLLPVDAAVAACCCHIEPLHELPGIT